MFTEGLDETAIKWIKQGTEAEAEAEDNRPKVRSPLAERTAPDPFPKSPSIFNNNGSLTPSSHALPPLKLHSGLLPVPRSTLVVPAFQNDDEEENDDNDGESISSVSDSTYSYEEALMGFNDSKQRVHLFDDEEIFGYKPSSYSMRKNVNIGLEGHNGSSLNKGLLNQSLRIEVPDNLRRFTDGELGFRKTSVHKNETPGSANHLQKRIHLRNCQGTLSRECSMLRDSVDLGTPSAPPIFYGPSDDGRNSTEVDNQQEMGAPEVFVSENDQSDNGTCPSRESVGFDANKEGYEHLKSDSLRTAELGERSVDKSFPGEERKMHNPVLLANQMDHSSYYSTSSQYAWQTLIAYDACIRLCLQAWASGCTEAPEFLLSECMVLRNAFGLHNYLLQPRGAQPIEDRHTNNAEQKCPKAKKVVGKIRVEVKKIRVITRRKLKMTYSQWGAISMHAGMEYVQNVVKTGVSSLKKASLSVSSQEPQLCLFQLTSATENNKMDSDSAICLHPGTGDYHVFFPESQGDALLVEVQDTKKSVLGRATIPISSLTDNPNDRIRWWPIHHDDQECIGKIQLSIGSTITNDETTHVKSGPVAETFAYDLLLEAAMRAQNLHSRNLWLHGPWKWLLTEFSDYYGVSVSYTKLRYLSHVMNVATPTKDCLELVHELLEPIIKARSDKCLTRQERSILLDCETQIESLIANVFENYKSLDEDSPTGIRDLHGPIQESAAPAIAPAVQVYSLLHDILSHEAQNMLRNYFQTAAKKRCRTHMVETDEFMSTNFEGFVMDSITISTAYLKMKTLCTNIGNEIQADIKIHNQHVLPSSIDLTNITAAVYSTELSNRLRAFLASWPPSSPQPHVNELLVATADFERNLELWNISPVQGGIDSRNLFHNYIMVWVQDMELHLLDLCKAEKVPWSGVSTNHSTSPFAEKMYEKMRELVIQYEVVINRWPQYSLVLENTVANVERAIIKALEKQYNDILTPLKDSIPKRLNMQVQKLTRRQSVAIYSVPNQLGTFLNTVKRILDVLHCKVEDILKAWASVLPSMGDKKSNFGEQMNAVTVLLRTKYKNYLQATVGKLINNMQENRNTRLKRILEETKEEDGEAEVRERMLLLNSQLVESISNLHEVFTSQIFIATCRGYWDRMGQIVLKFLEGRKENRVWYNGSYYALGILDDTFASQMQRLQGNALQDKDLELPRSVVEARSILCRDTTNATETSTYFYV
ncbi:uncharacterized protein LOC115699041 isoform X1 [Cannabis sativa]|uniref:Uncharacterized protein n=1 Tax=Cannabis sativa TaxID=3483 RepID=A0A7J6GFF8_CANSA|nr:uncharacterized protein LOC115699041 isoform X1 [Cannabis sativa]KAF4360031.1 hypothetical protein G4B88_025792 [Cannabis sativa]KAF4381701.1 hypothetical protein F8388_021329 [Cannabis sativa]